MTLRPSRTAGRHSFNFMRKLTLEKTQTPIKETVELDFETVAAAIRFFASVSKNDAWRNRLNELISRLDAVEERVKTLTVLCGVLFAFLVSIIVLFFTKL